MQTIGSVSGAFLYTWIGAHHNVQFIRLALLNASFLPVSALLATVVGPAPLYLGFLASGLALTNLFIGYQNWVVSYATPDQRPIYIGLFNTITAVISLIAPFIAGTIAQYLGYEVLFVVALIMVSGALFVVIRYVRSPRVEVVLAAAD
jgi:predicted MFS family arabinose efflux permease